MPFFEAPQLRKRKRDYDADVCKRYDHDNQPEVCRLDPIHGLPPHNVLPLPPNKRNRRLSSGDRLLYDGPHHLHSHHRRPSASPASLHKLLLAQPDPAGKAASRTGKALLEPCHICHRRPVKRSELDGFAECHGCGHRTCFVCLRQCEGWDTDDSSFPAGQHLLTRSLHMDDVDGDGVPLQLGDATTDQSWGRYGGEEEEEEEEEEEGWAASEEGRTPGQRTGAGSGARGTGWDTGKHRSVVCSRCCVEIGPEGDVVCLGCLSRWRET